MTIESIYDSIFLSHSIKMSYQTVYSVNKSMYTKLRYTIMFGGGNIIIHISGASGAGKSTMGNKLKKKFKDHIVVKDIDDLRHDFVDDTYGGYDEFDKTGISWDHKAFQSYIDKYVNKQTKPLIFVGLSTLPWEQISETIYYDMHADYNYYIQIDDMEVVKQKCIRFITKRLPKIIKSESTKQRLVSENEETVEGLKDLIEYECGADETLKMNKLWNKDYEKFGYQFMPHERIFESVSKILSKLLKKL